MVIARGGTPGWPAAAALSHEIHGILDITLVESEETGTVIVGANQQFVDGCARASDEIWKKAGAM